MPHAAYNLMPKKIQEKLPGLNETANLTSAQMPVIVKYFHPSSQWTWYIGAGEWDEDMQDWLLFGFVVGTYEELGYVTLSQLKSVTRLPIERDLYYNPDGNITLQDVIEGRNR